MDTNKNINGNKSLVITIIVVAILSIFVFFPYLSNNKTEVKNPISQYSSIGDLQNDVEFKFMVPQIVVEAVNSKDAKMYSYSGELVEIVSDDFVFRAGESIGPKADISGDYNSYEVDKRYISSSNSIKARYRTDNKISIINLYIDNMQYSIKFNTYKSEQDAFESFGVDYSKLEIDTNSKQETGESEIDKSESDKSESTSDSAVELGDDEISFVKMSNSDMGIEFMLAKTENKVTLVYSDNELAVLLGNKLVFVVENTTDNENYSESTVGYVTHQPVEGYTLKYVVNNPFEKWSSLYIDYYNIIENMDTVVNTFKVID